MTETPSSPLAARLGELNAVVEQVRSVTGTATDEDKAITVVVRPGGVLVDLRLAPGCMTMGPSELARAIKDVYEAATASADAQVGEAFRAQTLVPPDFLDRIRDGQIDLRATMRSLGLEDSLTAAENLAGHPLL